MKEIETERLALQSRLDAQKTSKQRNELGQFATPTLLASDILAFAKSLIDPSASIRFLDPALGTGAFYSALLSQFESGRIINAAGFEIDSHYGEAAASLWGEYPLSVNVADFTLMSPPDSEEKFNLLICNPPYVRHHHLKAEEKRRLAETAARACGVPMSGLSGLYCYFLAIAHSWLADDGLAGWLIPSEFMDVNYGSAVKRYLLENVELLQVHRFDPKELQFGDALVSSAVVWFRKRRPSTHQQPVMSFGGTLQNPRYSRSVSRIDLAQCPKWSCLAQEARKPTPGGLKLSDFFTIKRGVATGDNSFFIMSPEKIASLGLPAEFFQPILPGPRYLETDIIEAEPDGTPQLEKKLFILDCSLDKDEIDRQYPSLGRYLEAGRATAGETYICGHRSPWYSQERRPPAPFVCTYMGRGLSSRSKPFRFILNRSKATAANVYLMLYPKQPLSDALAGDPALALEIWRFLNSIPSETLLGEGRVYGGGLYKMEPKELANVPAAAIMALLPPSKNLPVAQATFFDEFVA